jgi:hypothetical protein
MKSLTPTVAVVSGNASFANVALGDSLLLDLVMEHLKGQEGIYQFIITTICLAGGGDFKTPYTSDNIGLLFWWKCDSRYSFVF